LLNISPFFPEIQQRLTYVTVCRSYPLAKLGAPPDSTTRNQQDGLNAIVLSRPPQRPRRLPVPLPRARRRLRRPRQQIHSAGLVPRADLPHPLLAPDILAARGLGHGLRPAAAVDHAGRPPPLAAVRSLCALRRGRPRLRLEGLQRAQRLHVRAGHAQRRGDRHVPGLRVAVFLAWEGCRGACWSEEGCRREGRRVGDCGRVQRGCHDVEQDGALLGERVLLRLRQHRPQPADGPAFPLDHSQRRLAPWLGLHDLFPWQRNRRRSGPRLENNQDRVIHGRSWHVRRISHQHRRGIVNHSVGKAPELKHAQ
ncbi:hypothetical protein CI238_00604, partial [Colletotrichum incanum]